MKELKNVYAIHGFTIGNTYKIIQNGANLVSVLDDNLILRRFEKIEGSRDFKNWFRGIL